ncbi:SDR family NAD(P)-dependent oxidoreductase [candidate division CSSED10-310 bacterium]|uniref:SDR family NAD(P)-dependent oxidoreductase n=1 Tax=candidate division CSSED10-310 bacterium TaxID=2855610 RepID=A0ABV6YVK8_UNCC1
MGDANLKNDTIARQAYITGASSGIGKAFAERMAREGFDITIIARRKQALADIAEKIHSNTGRKVSILGADLTRKQDLELVEKTIRQDDRLHLMVNNAGIGTEGAFNTLDIEKEQQMIRLNVEALLRLTHAALASMVPRNRGAIINLSSVVGFFPIPYYATYGATKAFVNSFTEALAEEFSSSNIKFQALCPGFTRTEFQQQAGVDASRIPSFLWMEPEKVVDISLQTLKRDVVLCVPGFINRMQSLLSGPLSRYTARRAMGLLGRKFILK